MVVKDKVKENLGKLNARETIMCQENTCNLQLNMLYYYPIESSRKEFNIMIIILTILQVLSGLAVTAIVLMQSGKSSGLSGAIAGGADTFMAKGKAKSLDERLAKWTKWFALAFVLFTLILNLL